MVDRKASPNAVRLGTAQALKDPVAVEQSMADPALPVLLSSESCLGPFRSLAMPVSGRRSLAARVLAATGDVETVRAILGHACLDHSKEYMTISQKTVQ